MNTRSVPQKNKRHPLAFAEQRKQILALPPQEALDRILEAPQPRALVHSFAEEDLYLFIQDIGPADSLPVLALASDKQWEFLLDLEVWHKDGINGHALSRWLDLFLQADPNRLIRWVVQAKLDLLEFFLCKSIEVAIREHDQDPGELGEGFFTLDGVYYLRSKALPEADGAAGSPSGGQPQSETESVVTQFLQRLADFDHLKYQQILLEAAALLPAESEEESYRLRNIRLAEKGFMPFEEAVGIYSRLRSEDLEKQSKKYLLQTATDLSLPAPYYTGGMLKAESLFSDSLMQIEADTVFQQLQVEFAGLCNQIISADQKRITSKEDLRQIVNKACGYISIGLERLSRTDEALQVKAAAVLLQKYPLADIFRVGYGLALELKWSAQKWQQTCWATQAGLPLSFYDEQWVGVSGGLLVKKPLFFDNYQTGVLYREFESLAEIRRSEALLNEIYAFDRFLSLMEIQTGNLGTYRFLTYKSLVLTLWARSMLGLSQELEPIDLKAFIPFFENLWVDTKKRHSISLTSRASFLDWLSKKTGLSPEEINAGVGPTLESLFKDIESELGYVSARDLDPRYVHLFLLKSA